MSNLNRPKDESDPPSSESLSRRRDVEELAREVANSEREIGQMATQMSELQKKIDDLSKRLLNGDESIVIRLATLNKELDHAQREFHRRIQDIDDELRQEINRVDERINGLEEQFTWNRSQDRADSREKLRFWGAIAGGIFGLAGAIMSLLL